MRGFCRYRVTDSLHLCKVVIGALGFLSKNILAK